MSNGQSEVSHVLHDHLGYGIDLGVQHGRFLLTERREVKLRAGATRLLCAAARRRRLVRARELAGFNGLAQSSGLALPLARCWLRAPFDDLSQRCSWAGDVQLSRQSMADLREFTRLRGSRHVGRRIWRPPDTAVGHVDAGPLGWGGDLDSSKRLPQAAGFWSAADAGRHRINVAS
jgi:hypothetical protein